MQKEVRRFKIDYRLEWEHGVEIKKLREDLEALEKLGATHVEIEASVSYECPYVTIEPVAEREETDIEFADRVDEINKRNEEQRRREIEQLKKLKAKYGG